LKKKFDKIIQASTFIEEILIYMVSEIDSTIQSKKRMMNNKVLGTMNQMMSDMEDRYGAEHGILCAQKSTWTGSFDRLEVFWLPASHSFQNIHGTKISAASTMIICNPNLGFAQLQQYSGQWLQFYHNFGINVVLWNYRGYAMSTGQPTP